MASEVATGSQHVAEGIAIPLLTKTDVDEARSGDLDGVHTRDGADRGRELLSDFAGLAREHRRKSHRDTGRVVTVIGVRGTLQGEIGHLATGHRRDGGRDRGVKVADGIAHERIVAKPNRRGGDGFSGGTATRD